MGLKKSPIAPNVPMSFLAQKTEGFSGADLAELCQRAAKSAIRDAIAAEELKDDAMDVGNEIGRKHFEEAFAGARRSVANNDLAKFDQFRRKFDPLYKQGGGEGMQMQWPDEPAIGARGGRFVRMTAESWQMRGNAMARRISTAA